MKTPVILRIFKNGQLVEVKQFDQDQIVIGHDADVQVDLAHESVSSIHCLVEKRDQDYYICDLGSKSGTFKNGQAILDEIPLRNKATVDSVIAAIIAPVQRLFNALGISPQAITALAWEANLEG